ncbi:MAG: hypothetical protein SGI98_05045 [Verrucomicrobiota bacterium]|nr:hypothetical protein [Verrucomicrobiota bacterium]
MRFRLTPKSLIPILICLYLLLPGGRVIAALPQDINPEQIALIEVRMWKAYYKKDYPALYNELLLAIQTQFRIPPDEALNIATDLAKAAYIFSTTQGSYEQSVLPDLSRAYDKIRIATKSDFAPESVAKAELAWWKARRVAGENSPENVGHLIEALYFELYGKKNNQIAEAALLRSQAAAIRDQTHITGTPPDWDKIEQKLRQSYTLLKEGIQDKIL